MVWLGDGSMAIVTGGRGRRSALYRISAEEPRDPDEPIAPEDGAPAVAATDSTRAPGKVAAQQRRAALELDPAIGTWAPAALAARDPVGWLAIARVGGAAWQAPLLSNLIEEPSPMSHGALRAIELCLARVGLPPEELRAALTARLEA